MGIEPTYSAWKADVLPLNYTRRSHQINGITCPVPESNQRHEDFQSSALPTELTGPAVSHSNKFILSEMRPDVKTHFRDIFADINL